MGIKKAQKVVQELIELTPEQKKAFAALRRGFTMCEKSGVELYQVLNEIHALNGHNVCTVDDDSTVHPFEVNFAQNYAIPSVTGPDSWADDPHFIQFHFDSCMRIYEALEKDD